MTETWQEILDHYLDPKNNSLTAKQKEMKERYDIAWGFCQQYSKITAMRLLAIKCSISESTAHKSILEMEKFYGSLLNFNQEFKRALYIEKLERLANKAEDKGDYGFAIKAIAEAAELGDLKNPKALTPKAGNTSYTLVLNVDGKQAHQFSLDGKGALPVGDITKILDQSIEVNQAEELLDKEFTEFYGEDQ